jgi:formylmethanofuran dehydrogenase subunit E
VQYTSFFNEVPKITLKDELALFLGSNQDGVVEFSYHDVVKVSGHSCPTVLGIYMMLQRGLETLYSKEELPQRGNIEVYFKEAQNHGVTGVMATVATMITGATSDFGFKGLNGKFNRCGLLSFENNIEGIFKLTRRDTQKSVTLNYDISTIQKPQRVTTLMQKCLQGVATLEEHKEFGMLWQKGVEGIFRKINNYIIVKL